MNDQPADAPGTLSDRERRLAFALPVPALISDGFDLQAMRLGSRGLFIGPLVPPDLPSSRRSSWHGRGSIDNSGTEPIEGSLPTSH